MEQVVARLGVLMWLVLGLSGCQCGPNNSDMGGKGGGASGGNNAGTGGNSTGTGGNSSSTGALKFEPAEATVVLDGNAATSKDVQFQLKQEQGGTWVSVTAEQVQFNRPDLGTAQAGSPVAVAVKSAFAGTGTLTATVGAQTATATLHVQQEVLEVIGNVPLSIVDVLKPETLDPDPTLTQLLYPYDATVFPLGLASPEIMWNASAAGDTYLLELKRKNYRYQRVFASPNPGRMTAPQERWDQVTTASDPTDALKLTLKRYSPTAGKAYVSARQEWTITDKSLGGAIYYWTTSNGGHLSRIFPGSGSAPETLLQGKCAGCHAVSADGSRMVVSVEDATSNDHAGVTSRAWKTYDLPQSTLVKQSTYFAGNLALNPNGKYVVYGYGPLRIADAASGARYTNTGIESLPLASTFTNHAHPAFSPDGKFLATIQTPGSWSEWLTGNLAITSFDEATLKFSGTKVLSKSADFPVVQRALAYPSFTPDSSAVAFHAGDHASGCFGAGMCDGNTQSFAALYLQSTSGSAAVPLSRLNDSSLKAADQSVSFEPTFNPRESGGYFWVVFTSTRDWGNRLMGVPANRKKRLWVAAIDKQFGTMDPSHPAFYLQGQEDTMNMRGFWTRSACVASGSADANKCSAGFQCCSGFCRENRCVDPGSNTCKPLGQSCSDVSECCNPAGSLCEGGICRSKIN